MYQNRIINLELHDARDLTPHPGNWRNHGKAQVEALRGVLGEVGIAGAILAYRSERNGGKLTVIDGHLRRDAAPQKWPVLILDVTDAEADYILATHDPLAAMADADAAALDALLASVNSGETAVQEMLAALAEDAGLYAESDKPTGDTEPQVNRAEELRAKWGVEPGQLWELGAHRLICGDCTDGAVVARVMGGGKADAVVTDPPYGTASKSKVQKRGNKIETFDIEWDQEAPIEWIPILNDVLQNGAGIISFWENAGITRLWDRLKKNGFNTLHTFYWEKTTVPQPRPNFCSSVESAVFARKPGKILAWNGGGATPNIRKANRAAGNERTPHETQKPIDLIAWLVELISESGFVVYEPFSGSGTTIMACETLGRKCRAVEISPAYVAVALERWAAHTGRTPELVP